MPIRVCNLTDGESISYALPLLIGEVQQEQPHIADTSIDVWNETTQGKVISWPVLGGQFKALVQLQEGINKIKFKSCTNQDTLSYTLIYKCPNFAKFVRPIYIRCCDDNGCFQGPQGEDNSPESAQKRIILGAQLIQTFTAEKLYEHSLGRRTFQLETDSKGQVVCHVVTTSLTLREAQSKEGGELWQHFAKELMTTDFPNKENCKWYAFMSFTRYNPPRDGSIPKTHAEVLEHTRGHCALGGGGLALFGTGNLHTWAESLDQVVSHFTDSRKIDRTLLMDDSAYRGFYWANYATGLGASLHELGHTFDLAHTNTGIMGRGFDDLNKVFTLRGARPVPQITFGDNKHAQTIFETQATASKPKESPSVVHIEAQFRPLHVTQVVKIQNYDGTVNSQVVADQSAALHNTQKDLRATIKQLQLSRENSIASKSSGTGSNSSSTVTTPTAAHPAQLPSSNTGSGNSVPHEQPLIKFADDGAHWFRSSAVLLRYHRWLNHTSPNDLVAAPVFMDGTLKAEPGFRLIELRSVPDGVVFHHWEFLSETPPKEFKLHKDELEMLHKEGEEVTVVAEDSCGNILKKKFAISELPA
ncbi:putative zinc metalloproteinase C607.06c [Lingula anatina]|uniref:Zinc metalloproteinase C607.06c n=1 Tax=Lingula anatina TaxID=7574 RepID=A0A1S3H3D7_LINAN|nr:putative zinc metalloproteinase C607.06c [Lingula anatina]|eukprot:XP_013379649.1 putative zinc metalloproteinase C607.06c [Lingula anatina]